MTDNILTPSDRRVQGLVMPGVVRDIRRLWDKSLENYLRIGEHLIAAKKEIGHGGFGVWVEATLPFGARTASNLIAVAERFGKIRSELKSETVSDLPREYSTLMHILKLPAPVIAEKVQSREISPDMTRNDAQRLVRTTQFAASAPPPPPEDSSALGEDLRVSLPRLAATGQKFRVVCADPAWEFVAWSKQGHDKNPDKYYATAAAKEFGTLPVADVCADDCVLFLWIVDWALPDALELIRSWGFEYKGLAFTWIKYWPGGPGGRGTGYWTASGTERVLLATRGAPARQSTSVCELIFAERDRRHSRKPEDVQDCIEQLCGGPYLELFARRIRDGWTCLGNEVETVLPLPPGEGRGEGFSPPIDGQAADVAVAEAGARGVALGVYQAEISGMSLPGEYRTPVLEIGAVLRPGDLVRTSYGTGPFRVVGIDEQAWTPPGWDIALRHWSLSLSEKLVPPVKGDDKPTHWINEIVPNGERRLLKLFDNNDDEIFVLTGDEAAQARLDIPPFLRRGVDS